MHNDEVINMDSQNDEETKESSSSESQQSQEREPASRLRDLRPEKDPMGAGLKTSPEKTQSSKAAERE